MATTRNLKTDSCTHQVTVRLRPKDVFRLEQYCIRTQATLSEAIRAGLEFAYRAEKRHSRYVIKKEFSSAELPLVPY